MTEEPTTDTGAALQLSPAAAQALAALLAIDAETAAQVRERTPSRRRHDPQYGPQLDLGDPGD